MKKKFGWIIGALVVALLAVGAYGVTSVYADDDDPSRPPFGERVPRGLRGEALEVVADVLGMSTDELTAALKDGKRLPELAEEAGVEMEEVRAALKEFQEKATRERIEQALEDGKITQEHADWLLEGLEKGFLKGRGFGHGGGRFQRGEGFGPPDTDS
ncbi:MAG: hypothetical protein Kow002_12090 [Anaerolineales bacterium]